MEIDTPQVTMCICFFMHSYECICYALSTYYALCISYLSCNEFIEIWSCKFHLQYLLTLPIKMTPHKAQYSFVLHASYGCIHYELCIMHNAINKLHYIHVT